MAEDKMNSLDARIVLAIESAPRAEIPAGFAARVARQLPARPMVVLSPGRYGQRAALACLLVLLVLMLAIAHKATGNSLYWSSIEWIFCAQFAALAVWLVVRGYSSPTSF
jgi:hypothetical protein